MADFLFPEIKKNIKGARQGRYRHASAGLCVEEPIRKLTRRAF